jgi:C-terminal processing protease CtpA/Prc
MTAATPGDGNVPTSRAWRIGHGGGFNRLLYSFAGIESPFRLAVRTPDGKDQIVNATGIAQPAFREMSAKRYPSDRKDGAADFRFEDDGAIAVLTVRTFGGSPANSEVPLDRYFPDVFRQIREKGSKTLIIDVRNNGGGADALGKQLFSFLWDKPFQYYDDLIINARTFGFKPYMTTPHDIPEDQVEKRDDGKYHAIKHPNWGTQQPSEPHFSGNVLVLINGGSFSTTCEFTSTVHFHKRAKFIGEEAGGGYYGNTSGFAAVITLPNSKLQVSIPLQTYYLAVSGYDRPDRSVIPDYPVHDTIQDLLSGKDNAMDLALRLARN